MRLRLRHKGQLTLGLAFGFTMLLALFAFVFNTSMNVREKIKLQQTSDFSALVAANAQKAYLNKVRDYNLFIEAQWFIALALQQINHCARPIYVPNQPITDPITGTLYSQVVAIVSAYLTANNFTSAEIPALEANGTVTTSGDVDPCDLICDQYNQSVNRRIRSNYSMFRTTTKGQVMNLIMNANQDSFQYALHHFLQPSNLPWGLQQKLKTVLGDNYTTSNTIDAYKNNVLSTQANNAEWGYDIVSENKDDPLFIPKDEIRPFPIPNFKYQQVVREASAGTFQTYCTAPPVQVYNPLEAKLSNVKVVKDGLYETHFFTGVNYLPPANMFENNEALVKRKTNPDELGQTEDQLSDPALFSRKAPMMARSAAKPFGGSFPASVLTDLVSFATDLIGGTGTSDTPGEFQEGAGKEFEGAKLFGIADEAEIGGFEMHRAEIEAEVVDEQGNIQEAWKILRKDYLH